jgi:hypothetical protein
MSLFQFMNVRKYNKQRLHCSTPCLSLSLVSSNHIGFPPRFTTWLSNSVQKNMGSDEKEKNASAMHADSKREKNEGCKSKSGGMRSEVK